MPGAPHFAGPNQPARRSFEIREVVVDGANVPVSTRDISTMPFCVIVEFSLTNAEMPGDILVVTPLSGHFPILLRDLIVGLIPHYQVLVTDWVNPRHVGIEHGLFGLETNISCVVQAMRQLRPGSIVAAVCQAGVPALAATAVVSSTHDGHAPGALILIGAPIDPLANPTGVAELVKAWPLSFVERTLTEAVPQEFAGQGRRVYPAHFRLMSLWTYMARSIATGGEMLDKALYDDGSDPHGFPFLDLYTSIMDLDARFFLENAASLYRDCTLSAGTMRFEGNLVKLREISETRLLTIEGEWDDIAAPGQSSAAHRLCTQLPPSAQRSRIIARSGHISLFHGDTFRHAVLPEILAFSAACCGGATPAAA